MQKRSIKISILTLFPDFIEQYAFFGIVARAIKLKLLKLKAFDLRSFGLGPRKMVDDRPYGGGVGMVLRPDVLYRAIESAKNFKFQISNFKLGTKPKKIKTRTILLTPQGKPFKQADAKRLAKYDHLLFVSGRYEGFDERVRSFVDEELSIGDYVLMGGELPALVITEAVIRLIPGILGKLESTEAESFSSAMLEYPQYTKPEILEVRSKKQEARKKTFRVPKVLLTGNHAKINAWREAEALKRTKKRRPDLLS